MKQIFVCIIFMVFSASGIAQILVPGEVIRKRNGNNQTNPNNADKDKKIADERNLGFEHRDDAKDSINLSYRYLDSTNRYRIDSSINDFDNYFTIPSDYKFLGNNGAAAYPLIFEPNMKAGWDAGFHAYDLYRFKLEETRIYRTTRPFTALGYMLASGKEQVISAMHTQNPKPNINFGLDYRIITAPGLFVTQNNSHNNIRLFGNYAGRRKRYNASIVVQNNLIRASENGGIQNTDDLSNPDKKDRFTVFVNMGNAAAFAPNPFVTSIQTGNTYRDFTFHLRQSWDLGKRDSIEINDSTTEYLFYPKLRIQHAVSYQNYNYRFRDLGADSTLYSNWYHQTLPDPEDSFMLKENWTVVTNDLSLYQFPDTKNASQFFVAGASLENIKGELPGGIENFYNIRLHGEYRNKTRNKLWNILASGEFYVNGLNAGDYQVQGKLSRYLNKKLGDVQLFFKNTNRTASFIFDNRSGFNLGNNSNFSKENITSFGATSNNAFAQLGVRNHILTNYHYFTNYHQTAQYSSIINLLQLTAAKKIKLTKHINWYVDATIQQTDGAAPIRVPFLFTRNRIAFEGQFYKNLSLSTGLDIRYNSAYKANHYSPVMGQFFAQDSIRINNRPDVAAFLHFRIKGFTGYIRAENLNTVSFQNGFGFIHNNFAAPNYPTPGMIIRFGIRWWFIN